MRTLISLILFGVLLGYEQIAEPSTIQKTSAITEQTGHYAINPQFVAVKEFSEGLAAVRIGDKWGFIDKQGTIVIKNPQFSRAYSFREGLAPVRIGDDKAGKWGFIDKQGTIVINPQFSSALSFQEGLAIVRIGDDKTGKWGFINR